MDSVSPLAPEQPRYQGEHQADQDARDDRKVKSSSRASDSNVARQAAQADAEPLTNNYERTGGYQHCACAN
jgi:hypothetical protein